MLIIRSKSFSYLSDNCQGSCSTVEGINLPVLLKLMINSSASLYIRMLPYMKSLMLFIRIQIEIRVKRWLSKSLLPIAKQGWRHWFSDLFRNKMTPWTMSIKYPTKQHVFLTSKFLFQVNISHIFSMKMSVWNRFKRQTVNTNVLSVTSQTIAQSWFTPFLPLLEKTEAKLLEPSTFTQPDDLKIRSFFLASFAIASAASLPSPFPEFFPRLIENDLPNNPLNMEENCLITSRILYHSHKGKNRRIKLSSPPCRSKVCPWKTNINSQINFTLWKTDK